MDEIDSLVLFPQENGKFKNDQIVHGATYEVHGTELIPQESSSVHSSPYGAYPTPSFIHNFPLPHPPRSSKTGKIKKNNHGG